MGALYDALRTGQGISEEDAKRAAEEVASYDNRMAALDSRTAVLTWMVGTNVAISLAIFWRVFS